MLLFVFRTNEEAKEADHLRLASICSFVQHLWVVPGAYLRRNHLKGDGLLHYIRSLYWPGKACQGQTVQLIWPLVNDEEKVSYETDTRSQGYDTFALATDEEAK
jgi:hypothetical protein